MLVGVQPQRVPSVDYGPHDVRVRLDLAAHEKKGCGGAVSLERFENARRPKRMRAVVEGEDYGPCADGATDESIDEDPPTENEYACKKKENIAGKRSDRRAKGWRPDE